jgi:hypothetical protein
VWKYPFRLGLTDFSWHNKPKWGKNTAKAIKIPNSHEIYQKFAFQLLQKYTKIGIFGMKINHLATLL